MAHFAQLDDNNHVTQVIVLNNDIVGEPDLTYPATEIMGQAFIMGTLKLPGLWKQTSYNDSFRKQYAGIGHIFDADADVFVAPQPFLSWSLDGNHDWQPPIPRPNEGVWNWDENSGKWIENIFPTT